MKHKNLNPENPSIRPNPKPSSTTGRTISARNATKHGCCSTETLILAAESHDEFKSLEQTWFRAYDPKETAEVHLVHQLVQADWFFQRAIRTCAEIEAQLFKSTPNPLDWTEAQQQTLARFLRYRTTNANNAAKARKAIEDYRRNRLQESARIQTAAHKHERHAIHKAEHSPALTWDEEITALKEKSVRLGYLTPDGQPASKH